MPFKHLGLHKEPSLNHTSQGQVIAPSSSNELNSFSKTWFFLLSSYSLFCPSGTPNPCLTLPMLLSVMMIFAVQYCNLRSSSFPRFLLFEAVRIILRPTFFPRYVADPWCDQSKSFTSLLPSHIFRRGYQARTVPPSQLFMLGRTMTSLKDPNDNISVLDFKFKHDLVCKMVSKFVPLQQCKPFKSCVSSRTNLYIARAE